MNIVSMNVIKGIHWSWIFWALVIAISLAIALYFHFKLDFNFTLAFADSIIFTLKVAIIIILLPYFIFLLQASNFIEEWLIYQISDNKWKKFLITILLISFAFFLSIAVKVGLYTYTENIDMLIKTIKQEGLTFILALESMFFIILLFTNAAQTLPKKLKTQLNQISPELTVKQPSEAIRKGFVIFESHLREKLNMPSSMTGKRLIYEAFGEKRLLEYSSVKSEQEGIRDLIAGFYAVYRNPIMHHDLKKDKDTAELILLQLDEFIKIVNKSTLKIKEEQPITLTPKKN